MELIAEKELNLNQEELLTLNKWRSEKNKPQLSTSLSLKLFELFLNGSSCDEIVKVNNNLITLGQVLEVRVRDGWDDKKSKYLAELYSGVVDRVRQTQMEAVSFTADLLAATHKLHGTKIKKFIQSGDEKEMGGLAINGLQSYQKAVDILLKLTGQDKKEASAKLQMPVSSSTAVASSVVSDKLLPGGTENLNSSIADRVLQFLESGNLDE